MSFPSLFFRLSALGGLALLGLAGCTDAYLPDVIKVPPSLLVVDGTINPQGVTTLKLSRTYAIASALAPPVEAKATAFVEEENGARYALREAPLGTYSTTTSLALNPAKKYRVHLTTAAGKEYASAYVPVKLTPPVDDVSWRVDNDGLNIYVSTHDPANASQYYRWETIDTWEIIPQIQPRLEYVNRTLRLITVPYPTICWGTAASNPVQLYKTTGLTQDVVSDFRVRRLSPTSERLTSRYSILVQQHALTKEEYAYWELLRQNTESIGSLFDPQPAQLTGNVRCLSSPDELALGFVGAHSTTEKRLFIRRQDLPNPRAILTGYEGCFPTDSIYIPPRGIFPPIPTADEILFAAFNNPNFLPIDAFSSPTGGGVLGAKRDCIDCRTRGTSVKPSFWP